MKLSALIFSLPLLLLSGEARRLGNGNGNGRNRDYDCDQGCSLERQGNGQMVCGTDGITYWNECLAVCQGIEIEKPGACPGGPGDHGNPHDDTFEDHGFASIGEMKRFESEGYKMVGKRKVLDDYEVEEQIAEEEPEELILPEKIRMVRLADDANEYVADVLASELNVPGIDLDPVDPENEPQEEEDGEGGRQLWVFGDDNRQELKGYNSNQYLSSYSLQNRVSGRTSNGCTGTVIYTDAVLTAGHCVHTGKRADGSSGYWIRPNFSPAQWRSSSGTVYRPYGTWNYRTATTYYGWTNGYKAFQYDIAVLRVHPQDNWRGHVGSYLGYNGLRYVSGTSYLNSVDSSNQINTIGYPSDKEYGEAWKSPCWTETSWYSVSSPYIAEHYCDIYYGNSGGNFQDKYRYSYGVQSYHGSRNGAVILYGMHYNNVLRWSGRT